MEKKKGSQNNYGGSRSTDCCRELVNKLKILHFCLQNLVPHLLSVINNKDHYKLNSDIHNINSR